MCLSDNKKHFRKLLYTFTYKVMKNISLLQLFKTTSYTKLNVCLGFPFSGTYVHLHGYLNFVIILSVFNSYRFL